MTVKVHYCQSSGASWYSTSRVTACGLTTLDFAIESWDNIPISTFISPHIYYWCEKCKESEEFKQDQIAFEIGFECDPFKWRTR